MQIPLLPEHLAAIEAARQRTGSVNSRRGYDGAWRRFAAWCEELRLPGPARPLPKCWRPHTWLSLGREGKKACSHDQALTGLAITSTSTRASGLANPADSEDRTRRHVRTWSGSMGEEQKQARPLDAAAFAVIRRSAAVPRRRPDGSREDLDEALRARRRGHRHHLGDARRHAPRRRGLRAGVVRRAALERTAAAGSTSGAARPTSGRWGSLQLPGPPGHGRPRAKSAPVFTTAETRVFRLKARQPLQPDQRTRADGGRPGRGLQRAQPAHRDVHRPGGGRLRASRPPAGRAVEDGVRHARPKYIRGMTAGQECGGPLCTPGGDRRRPETASQEPSGDGMGHF